MLVVVLCSTSIVVASHSLSPPMFNTSSDQKKKNSTSIVMVLVLELDNYDSDPLFCFFFIMTPCFLFSCSVLETASVGTGCGRHKQEHSGDHIPIKLAQETIPGLQNRPHPKSPKHPQNNR